ncbi:cobinamide kinase/cobinamide phosphate guanyltransferase [Burkholderia pseudomallei]|uniref:bifunctional adenosylcobinamide kinase/adenosylcobinamide-phosphate guanylyltransferase n=1 Tax=Burkholderia pseudomallei TaxID=28450 RepID=UPI000F29143A|nr:bifunctional adenosylcobinamide kinase/adenosylcobinamide-phosphate guanylyltransferase [Burkholderia pseudomallei]VBV84992.1 cobinamide kinase/cobinamide phosphate guanyltransferase [Burkholderia pseudomallei]
MAKAALSRGPLQSRDDSARVADDEFAERIAHHRARRPAGWALVEAPVELAPALARLDDANACVLVDCLTLWLTNLLCPADGPGVDDARCDAYVAELEAALRASRARVIVVSNEIGFGVVPLGRQTRRFVDTLGRVNQRIAALATRVTLCVAGLPVMVKDEGEPRC